MAVGIKRPVVRVRNDAYELALKEVEEGREESLCELVSRAVKFYLSAKKLMNHDLIDNMIEFYQNAKELVNPLPEPHSKENTAKKRPAKAGLPVGVCASSRKSPSAESRSSLLGVFRIPPVFLRSRRLIPAFGRFGSEERLHLEAQSFEELEEEAKRIVVKHPAFFDNFQRNDVGFRAVVRPDGSWSVEPLAPSV